jgi:hypothetical protein
VGGQVSVLYIAGMHRSGSTLLDSLLGATPGIVGAGELRHVWRAAFLRNLLCGCGAHVRRCAFWKEVAQEAFGGFKGVDVPPLRRTDRQLFRMRNAPALRWPRLARGEVAERLDAYASAYATLVRAIARVSGAAVVSDSSKHPWFGAAIQRSGLPVRTVHLVRDSRAVAYSWTRPKFIQRTRKRRGQFPVLSAQRAATWWLSSNALAEFALRGGPYLRVRYEDLVRDPERVMARIQRFAGLDPAPLLRDETGGFVAGEGHTIHGNPVRFERGAIRITPDEEWVCAQQARDRRVVTAMTAPMLARYGYPLRVPAGAGS